ncbi:MAG TPA: SRPBCC domain-containing protein [Xanthobacteraceae bacterium]
MTYAFTLTDVIPASPQAIYDAWLDSRGHTAMTGSKAKMSNKLGDEVSAWDRYIWGKNVVLEPGKRIVQTWRTRKFTDEDPDSKITLTFAPVEGGTQITLDHSGVPDSHTSYEQGGWQQSYFEPMKKYFGKSRPARRKSTRRRPPKRKTTKAKTKKRKSTKRRGRR